MDDDKISSMLNIQKTGEEQYNDFVQNRLLSDEIKFHDTLTRNKLVLFKDCGKNVVVNKDGKLKSIEVNRNIIGNLLALSAKTGQLIDFNKALEFPLCPVDLNLSNPDGSRRSTQKSKLTEIIIQELTLMNNAEFPQKSEVIAYVVDLMALVRTITNIPGTYEELTFQLIRLLPTGYKRVDIVADTYREVSIKDPERRKRGCTDKVLIRSAKSKVPRNFNEFLQNRENKTRLIDLILTVILERKLEVLSSLNSKEIYFSTDGQCHKINRDDVINVPELSSNQEEADTKLCLHARHALNSADRETVIVRNHSGDVDINVILIAKTIDTPERVILDFNKGKYRKLLWLSDIDMTDDEKKCLIGFHAFTGSDYTSAFFRKGKAICWKVLRSNSKFLQTFVTLGDEWMPSESLMNSLEEFVCYLFGSLHLKKINLL